MTIFQEEIKAKNTPVILSDINEKSKYNFNYLINLFNLSIRLRIIYNIIILIKIYNYN